MARENGEKSEEREVRRERTVRERRLERVTRKSPEDDEKSDKNGAEVGLRAISEGEARGIQGEKRDGTRKIKTWHGERRKEGRKGEILNEGPESKYTPTQGREGMRGEMVEMEKEVGEKR